MGVELIASLLAPALIDGFKGLINKWTGGVQPQSIDDVKKLAEIETEKLKALAAMDTPVGTPSQWVIDCRAIFRYAAVFIIWAVAGLSVAFNAPPAILTVLFDMCGMSMFFILGERMYLNFKK